MFIVQDDAVIEVLLCQNLISAYWYRNDVAEVAALDQIRAYVAQDLRRATNLAQLALRYSATLMRALAQRQGHARPRWVIGSVPDVHRGDAQAREVVCDALEDELNDRGTGLSLVQIWLADADVNAACSLIREALWIAAEVGWKAV